MRHVKRKPPTFWDTWATIGGAYHNHAKVVFDYNPSDKGMLYDEVKITAVIVDGAEKVGDISKREMIDLEERVSEFIYEEIRSES